MTPDTNNGSGPCRVIMQNGVFAPDVPPGARRYYLSLQPAVPDATEPKPGPKPMDTVKGRAVASEKTKARAKRVVKCPYGCGRTIGVTGLASHRKAFHS